MKSNQRTLWFGVSAGIMIGFAIFSAVSKAQDPNGQQNRGNCSVKLGHAYITGGYQCPFDRVMVGHWNDNLYCADIIVSCP
jgi:hypothetical protein